MTGGGFGGSAIALVPADQAESIGSRIVAAFAAEGLDAPQPFAATAGPSAGRDH
jgi:galactokinase